MEIVQLINIIDSSCAKKFEIGAKSYEPTQEGGSQNYIPKLRGQDLNYKFSCREDFRGGALGRVSEQEAN